jgi:hypothetical protein
MILEINKSKEYTSLGQLFHFHIESEINLLGFMVLKTLQKEVIQLKSLLNEL